MVPGRWLALVALSCAACDGGGGDTADAGPSDDGSVTCSDGPGWTPAPPMPDGPTQETAVVELNGRIYSLGGFDAAFTVLDRVHVFDPATCMWSAGPALPRPLHHVNAAVLGGRIYVVGALTDLGFVAVGDTMSIDPETESAWTMHTPMPAGTERGSSQTAVVGDSIVVAGGLRGGSLPQASAYRPSTDEWRALPSLPTARDHGCAASIDGAMYVIGGRTNILDGTVVRLSADETTWEQRARMPTARAGMACGIVGGEIITAGGEGNAAVSTGVFAEVEGYTPATDTWRTLPAMRTPRHGMGGAGLGDRFYVPGGADEDGFAAVDTHEVLAVAP